MTLFVWNLLLAIIWAVALGPFTPWNVIVGFVVGYLTLLLARRAVSGLGTQGDDAPMYFEKVREVVYFLGYFVWALGKANVQMAAYTLSPLSRIKPGIVAVPVQEMSDFEITTLANLITLTPGTLTLDVSPDRRTLYVHVMDASDAERIREEIKSGFEEKLLAVLR